MSMSTSSLCDFSWEPATSLQVTPRSSKALTKATRSADTKQDSKISRELLQAVRDTIEADRQAWKVGVSHRDVSTENVPISERPEDRLRGLLHDFDYSSITRAISQQPLDDSPLAGPLLSSLQRVVYAAKCCHSAAAILPVAIAILPADLPWQILADI
ncbi:hypothetical protein BD309DRAFT_958089 [Dichomitus squalens]|uniref:Uncharacterized protein n=1 Tax=Dichomitus squalens TaxID=114155 RepID=A0A4Q9PM19_9APHY|nr:hypothetical protein BD309DRAFT_958089 [Dichomitus squalens]TBU55252.1 hypothetical protein BD310DRAFT_884679 [Dichomitus squalens]